LPTSITFELEGDCTLIDDEAVDLFGAGAPADLVAGLNKNGPQTRMDKTRSRTQATCPSPNDDRIGPDLCHAASFP